MGDDIMSMRFGANDRNSDSEDEEVIIESSDDEIDDNDTTDEDSDSAFDEDGANNLAIFAVIAASLGVIFSVLAFFFSGVAMMCVALLGFAFAAVFAGASRKADAENGYASPIWLNVAYWIGLIGVIAWLIGIVVLGVYTMGLDQDQSADALGKLINFM